MSSVKSLKRLLSTAASFAFYPAALSIFMRSVELKFLTDNVNKMCVWCNFGELGNSNCYDNWAHLWDYIRSFIPDPRMFFIVGTFIVSSLAFWIWSAVLCYLDNHPWKVLQKYKIQPDENVPVDRKKFWKAVWQVVFNQTIIQIPLSIIVYPAFRGMVDAPIPNLDQAVMQLAVFVLMEEIFFYYGHRLMHSPFWYKRIHKQHHEWTAPIGIIALYAHPFEHVTGNLLPVVVGPIICQSHLGLVWIWFTFGMLTTVNTHCGYHFPFFFSPRAHDYHHEKFNEVFGVMGWLDEFHGTNKNWKKTESFALHETFFSVDPPFDNRVKGSKFRAGEKYESNHVMRKNVKLN